MTDPNPETRLLDWIEDHPDVATVPVELRPRATFVGWLQRGGYIVQIDTDGNVRRRDPEAATTELHTTRPEALLVDERLGRRRRGSTLEASAETPSPLAICRDCPTPYMSHRDRGHPFTPVAIGDPIPHWLNAAQRAAFLRSAAEPLISPAMLRTVRTDAELFGVGFLKVTAPDPASGVIVERIEPRRVVLYDEPSRPTRAELETLVGEINDEADQNHGGWVDGARWAAAQLERLLAATPDTDGL